MLIIKPTHFFVAAGVLYSLPFSFAQNTPNENLVLADCGIGLGSDGGSTSREMIYYSGDVWTGNDLDTHKPTMMVNVPWSGSYPWGQAGGVSASMPNGDAFTVHIDASVKDPNAAGDAWHKYEMEKPLKCYSYHWDQVYQLDDGKWCSSAYVCNHHDKAYIKPDDGNGGDGDDDDDGGDDDEMELTASTNSDWVELYDQTVDSVIGVVWRTFDDASAHCDNTAIPVGSGCTIVWKCRGDPDEGIIKRMAGGFSDLAKLDEFSSHREVTSEICRRQDTRPGHEGECLEYEEKTDYYVKLPRSIEMSVDNVPDKDDSWMNYEITCEESTTECDLCNGLATVVSVFSGAAGATISISCALSLC